MTGGFKLALRQMDIVDDKEKRDWILTMQEYSGYLMKLK